MKNQYDWESKKERIDKNGGFYIVFCYSGSGELWNEMARAAEGEMWRIVG